MTASIPAITRSTATEPVYQQFLTALRSSRFSGDISDDYATRLVHATDNSVYQLLPQAVVFPRHEGDVQLLFKLAQQREFSAVHFAPRGGGTGTNGQSLNLGVVIDLSRFMNRIVDIDFGQQHARVQPGVILDQLQDQINPKGFFFAPELSPSNRATLGGMANTDACGKGSRLYGRTGDHVVSLRIVLLNGDVIETTRLDDVQFQLKIKQDNSEGVLYRNVADACRHAPVHPGAEKLGRFITAYNLWNAFDQHNQSFSLNPVLCGSEGTLAVITELRVKLTPLPKQKALFAVRYKTFDHALSAAQQLLKHQPSAVETVDDKILTLSKNDIIFPKVRPYLGDDDDFSGNAVNLVEFVADTREAFENKVNALKAELPSEPGVISFHYTEEKNAQNALWDLRKKGVGLLGNTKGKRRPIPFVEDTAVPPENLAAYITEFRALLDKHGLTYGMFGHVDVGCLHVRPALDLRNNVDEKLFKEISDHVYALVNKYGGVMWSEHGKGFRSAYGPDFHGPDIYGRMQKIKTAFDPHNRLNPGKICTPQNTNDRLYDTFSHTRAAHDNTISVQAETLAQGALYCNGNGQCFDYRMDSVMCPSYKATGNRLHSPKGRSGLMREWLKQMAASSLNLSPATTAPLSLTQRLQREIRRILPRQHDFSHDVKTAMDGCLACKACATQCPIKVDVPTQKSLFLFHYHRRYPRRLRDYLLGGMEAWAEFASRLPGISNVVMLNPLSRAITRGLLGLTAMPYFSETSLDSILWRHPHWRFDAAAIQHLSAEQKAKTVFIAQDTFTSFFDTDVVFSTAWVLEKLGFKVVILPYLANGKALHVKGRLNEFDMVARKSIQRLRQWVPQDLPVIAIEPAVALMWRQEYAALNCEMVPNVLMIQEFLSQKRIEKRLSSLKPIYHFSHCTEKTQAVAAPEQWKAVFAQFGLDLRLMNTGCCGMAGSFGHESENATVSQTLFDQNWRDALKNASQDGIISVSGFSCRSQTERFSNYKTHHPMQILQKLMS